MTVHLGTCGIASSAAPRRVGDERHLVFECPAVQHIRDYHSDLFWDGQNMREFVNRQTDQAAVMDFIVAYFDSFIQTDQLSSERF